MMQKNLSLRTNTGLFTDDKRKIKTSISSNGSTHRKGHEERKAKVVLQTGSTGYVLSYDRVYSVIMSKINKPQIPSRAPEGRRHVCPAGIRGSFLKSKEVRDMKTILITPSQNSKYPQPPLGLSSIAAVLEQKGLQVGIMDANALQLSECMRYVTLRDNTENRENINRSAQF